MQILKRVRRNALAAATLYAVLGLLFVVKPDVTMRAACYILAGWLLAAGILSVLDYFRSWTLERRSNALSAGLSAILAALFLLLKTDLAISAIPVLLGFSVLVSAAVKAEAAVTLYKVGDRLWLAALIGALLCAALGAVLIENPFSAAATLVTVTGVGLLFCGVTDLLAALRIAGRVKAVKSAVKEAVKREA